MSYQVDRNTRTPLVRLFRNSYIFGISYFEKTSENILAEILHFM